MEGPPSATATEAPVETYIAQMKAWGFCVIPGVVSVDQLPEV
jgi:hypothetical protein